MVNQRGAALLIALLLSAIITVVMLSMMSVTKLNNQIYQLLNDDLNTRMQLDSVKAELFMALYSTPLHLIGAEPSSPFNFYGRPFEFRNTEVTIQDLTGLVVIDRFTHNELKGRLISLLPEHPNLNALTDELLDWVDEDDLVRLEGAENRDYASTSFPLNQRIQRLEELAFLPSLSERDYLALAGRVDINSGNSYNPVFTPNVLIDGLLSEQDADNLRTARRLNESNGDNIDGTGYPSGLFIVTIKPLNNKNKQLQIKVIRGLGTIKPIYVTDEIYR